MRTCAFALRQQVLFVCLDHAFIGSMILPACCCRTACCYQLLSCTLVKNLAAGSLCEKERQLIFSETQFAQQAPKERNQQVT